MLRNPGKHQWIGPAWPGDYKSSAPLVLAVPLLWHGWLAALGECLCLCCILGSLEPFVALNYSPPRTIPATKMIKGLEQLS